MEGGTASVGNCSSPQPHAAFAAFTHGFVHKFTYLSRTTPNSEYLLQPLEDIIHSKLIPAWTGRAPPNDIELFALQAHLGGLGIVNPASSSSREFNASVSISAPLSHLIKHQVPEYSGNTIEAQMHAKQEVCKQRQEVLKFSGATLKVTLKDPLKHAIHLALEKGAST